MKEYKPRNLITIADEIINTIADEIINIIKTHSDLKVERADEVIRKIEKVKKDYRYTAPEITYMCWEELSKVLSQYLYLVTLNRKQK